MPLPPPPAVALAALLTQRIVARDRPRTTPGRAVLAGAVALGSVTLAGTAARTFRRTGTTLDPSDPSAASSLVTTGPNTLTRNPMYLGLTGLLVANGIRLGAWPALLPVGAFVLAMDRLQIPAEEAALQQRFGPEYDAYRGWVPRWLDARSASRVRRSLVRGEH